MQTLTSDKHTAESLTIAALNDNFRQSFNPEFGQVVMSSGVSRLPPAAISSLVKKVQAFNEFNDENDPYSEHDFGAFKLGCIRFFWKIDYYTKNLKWSSDDPADTSITARVLTILKASEY